MQPTHPTRVLHLSASLSRKAGGIFEIALAVARHLDRLGLEVSAAGLEDDSWELDKDRWHPVPATVFPIAGPAAFGYAPGLSQHLHSSRPEVLHLHSMWMYPSVAVSSWASSTGHPYLVTPNGMLEPWALANSGWKKSIARALYEMKMLRNAGCLHANTLKELADIRTFGLDNPVALIPNGVDLPDHPQGPGPSTPPVLLFLGRLHPKKGIANALKAWSGLQDELRAMPPERRWTFVIAGWDQGGHEAELRRLCAECGLACMDVPAREFKAGHLPDAPVIFTGPAFGEGKTRLLESASAFILPSFSEGLPMSILEAWAHALPVLMTDPCNLPEGFSSGAAIRIDPESGSIRAALRDLIRMPSDSRSAIGARGRALAADRFSWTSVADRLAQVYQWLAGRGERPTCVVTAD